MASIFDTAEVVQTNPSEDTSNNTNNGGAPPPAAEGVPPTPEPASTPPLPAVGAPATITPDLVLGEEWREKKWEDVKSDYQTKKERLDILEKENAEIKGRSPQFADPEIAEYNAWVSNGGIKDYAAFKLIKNVETSTLDSVDAIIAQRIIQNPEYKGLEGMLKREIVEKYKLVSTEDDPLSEEQITFNKAKLDIEAKGAKEFLSGEKVKMHVQVPDPEAQAKVTAKRVESWNPIVDKTLSDIKSIPIPFLKIGEEGKTVKDDKGQDVIDSFGDYPIPDHLKGRYKEMAMQVLSSADVNEQMAKELPGFLQMKMIVDNLPYIISHVTQVTEKRLIDEYDKKYGGAGQLPPPGAKGNPGGTPSSNAEQFNSFRNTISNNP